MKTQPQVSNGSVQMAGYAVIAVLVIASLSWQLWLLHEHWINPDEGAHLMDAQLVLDGFVPKLDFGARQPLYVYSYVPFLKLLGSSTAAGRFMPVLCTWATALLLFEIGRRLWDKNHGLLSAALFLCAPSIALNASVVKTEPLAMMVTSLGFLGLIVALQHGRRWPLVMAGFAFGAGFYIRESTLAGLIAATVLSAVFSTSVKQAVFKVLLLWSGFIAACVGVLLWYWQYIPLGEVLRYQTLFPPVRIWTAITDFVGPLFSDVAAGTATVDGEMFDSVRKSPQGLASTVAQIAGAARFNVPFVIAAVFALLAAVRRCLPISDAKRNLTGPIFGGVTISLVWLLGFGVLYAYYALKRGFFQYYFREFIPPMALLLAWVIFELLTRLDKQRFAVPSVGFGLSICLGLFFFERLTGGAGLLWATFATAGAGWFTCRHSFRGPKSVATYFAGISLILALLFVLGLGPQSSNLHSLTNWLWLGVVFIAVTATLWLTTSLDRSQFAAAAAAACIAGSAAAVCTYGSSRLGPDYDCVWSAQTLDEVANLIRENSEPGESVLSGAVIWEFEAGRRTIARLTHPLSLRDNSDRAVPEELLSELKTAPPRIIVVDGYTEQTYFARIPTLTALVDQEYELIGEVSGDRHPVRVFRRNDSVDPTR